MLVRKWEVTDPMDRITMGMLEEFVSMYDIRRLPESEQFEQFCCYAIVRRHYSETFKPGDITMGDAFGIDGIAVIVNGALVFDVESIIELADRSGSLDVMFVFIQAERSSSFDSAKLGNFTLAVSDFFRDEPTLPRNQEVDEAAAIMREVYKRSSKFKSGNPSCRLYYTTTGKKQDDQVLDTRRQQGVADITSIGVFRSVDCQLLDAEALQALYRQARNAIAKEFVFVKRSTIPELPGIAQAFIGYIPATELIKLIEDDDGEIIGGIFYANVRDWEEYNEVNSEIRATLESPMKGRFVLMNNGITITARSLISTGDRFHIEDFQIVNGCQTCNVLFDQQSLVDDSVLVPLRLISTQDEELINSITKATNRQTTVKPEQFFALTEFPKRLEQFFDTYQAPNRLYYERRSRQYDRRDNIEKTRIVTQADMIRTFAAMFIEEPHGTTRSKKSLTNKVGEEIFAPDHRLEPYYVAAFTNYKLDFLFRNRRLEAKYKPARFHILLATRIFANPAPLPRMNSKEMEKYCDVVCAALWDPSCAESLLFRAVRAVDQVAQGNFHRDNIRRLAVTNALKAFCAAGG
jgi:hypothetical protein